MQLDKPMSILLVEDNIIEIELFKDYIESREDIKLIGIVDSAEKALEYIQTHMPDGIILDIELNNGKGSGLEVLEGLKNLKLSVKPVIVITTNILSDTVYAYAHKNGADMIFYKLKDDYSAEEVIRNLLILRSSSLNLNKNTITKETINDKKERISSRINRELDLVGIGSHLTGRKYIHDAIMYLLEHENNGESVFLHLAKIYGKGNSTIGRSIQTAIEHAWRKSSIEDLQKYYTTTVNYNTGIPTPTEFIYYYADKLRKSL